LPRAEQGRAAAGLAAGDRRIDASRGLQQVAGCGVGRIDLERGGAQQRRIGGGKRPDGDEAPLAARRLDRQQPGCGQPLQ
jgi:hypothetical protein